MARIASAMSRSVFNPVAVTGRNILGVSDTVVGRSSPSPTTHPTVPSQDSVSPIAATTPTVDSSGGVGIVPSQDTGQGVGASYQSGSGGNIQYLGGGGVSYLGDTTGSGGFGYTGSDAGFIDSSTNDYSWQSNLDSSQAPQADSSTGQAWGADFWAGLSSEAGADLSWLGRAAGGLLPYAGLALDVIAPEVGVPISLISSLSTLL